MIPEEPLITINVCWCFPVLLLVVAGIWAWFVRDDITIALSSTGTASSEDSTPTSARANGSSKAGNTTSSRPAEKYVPGTDDVIADDTVYTKPKIFLHDYGHGFQFPVPVTVGATAKHLIAMLSLTELTKDVPCLEHPSSSYPTIFVAQSKKLGRMHSKQDMSILYGADPHRFWIVPPGTQPKFTVFDPKHNVRFHFPSETTPVYSGDSIHSLKQALQKMQAIKEKEAFVLLSAMHGVLANSKSLFELHINKGTELIVERIEKSSQPPQDKELKTESEISLVKIFDETQDGERREFYELKCTLLVTNHSQSTHYTLVRMNLYQSSPIGPILRTSVPATDNDGNLVAREVKPGVRLSFNVTFNSVPKNTATFDSRNFYLELIAIPSAYNSEPYRQLKQHQMVVSDPRMYASIYK